MEWDNDSDYAHNEAGECSRCGRTFDMWNQYGIEHTLCQVCRRKDRQAKAEADAVKAKEALAKSLAMIP